MSRSFWAGLPFFAAATVYGFSGGHVWAIVVAGLLAVGNVVGQMYGFRKSRLPLSEISEDRRVQARASKLASDEAKPRLVRWIPGA